MASHSRPSLFFSKLKRRLAKHLPWVKRGLVALGALALACGLYFLIPSVLRIMGHLTKGPMLVLSLFSRTPQDLASTDGRTNILLLGAGGAGHEGVDLTDTIIFISTDLSSGDTLMLSLPRDIWIPSMRAKINTAYHYGNERRSGGGLVLAKAAASEILDQPIHYVLLIDFEGFKKAIDLLGGVEIEVERAFDDYQYPIPGMEEAEPEEARYEHLHFEAGKQLMDGERALKYVRSRYAEGEEGTDFARSRRQQRLLLAIKEKVLSSQTLLNPKRIAELVNIFGESIDTDIGQPEYGGLVKLALKFKQENLRTEVLDGGTGNNEGYLINPPAYQYDGQWVLIPRSGDWSEVQDYVKGLLFPRP
jgi:LCP family protein required for cell wall assembly